MKYQVIIKITNIESRSTAEHLGSTTEEWIRDNFGIDMPEEAKVKMQIKQTGKGKK